VTSVRPTAYPAIPALPADVVVFGEALVDMFPEQLGIPLDEVGRFIRHLGGAPANLAVGLCRQGVPTALVTLVGNDAFGRFVKRALADEGVVVDAVGQHKSARTGVTFVSIGVGGARGFLFYRHPSADMLIAPAHVDAQPQHIRRGRVFHFGTSTLAREPSRSATLRALELLSTTQPRKLLSCDLNLRPHLWPEIKEAPPLLRKLLGDCDIVKLTPEELLLLFGSESSEEGAARLRQQGVTVVVVTLGARGCYLDCPAGKSHFAAESVRVVDTTGAGDAFTAGLLSGLLQKLSGPGPDDLRERLRTLGLESYKRVILRANHLAAQVCTTVGATTALPRLAEPR
jgi:fructokinase